ncbi:MAG: hypothetical protein MSG64_11155 [Pyrinomonadaceae bacterium MAG19_C2-C3]|nr:hypothetical protein [Pyrinomonadaceae bacterium MAG19_C2-C3]
MLNIETDFAPDRKDAEAIDNYLKPLPRSVVRPNDYQLLDGEWRFAIDLEDRGLHSKWYLAHDYPDIAPFPGSIESHLAKARDALADTPTWQDTVVAWYERDFSLPDAVHVAPDMLLQLTFGACGYETRVWLNGHPLTTIEGEEVHFGEYTSFSYELPPALLQGENRLTVRIADSMDAEIPRGKQQSRVFKQGGIWYHTYTGAVRSVWLETVERNRLRSRLSVSSQIDNRLVEFTFTTRTRDPGLYTLRLTVTPRPTPGAQATNNHSQPITAEYKLPLEYGEKVQRVTLEMPNAKLWSTVEPRLYGLVAELITPAGNSARIEAHFGLRKIETRGRHVHLNDDRIYLDGILYQPGTATFEQMRRHLRAMKRLGCNLVRVHIAGVDPRIYDLADEMGMLLWVEVPSPHSSSQRSRENHWAELMRMLALIGSHPSIVIWSLYNEDWGAQDIAYNPETRRYITHAYDYMRLNHPELLVVDNDGWNHVSTEGRLESDLLTAHLYTPDIDVWQQLLDRLTAGDTVGVAVQPLVVGDPFFYRGQVPLMVSEWGGFGWSGYGGPEEAHDKAERITAFKRELRKRPIAGDVYTQATSIEEENNGVIDPDTGELSVPAGLLKSEAV